MSEKGKLQLVIEEIVTSEQDYVNHLEVLTSRFAKPLKELGAKGSVDSAAVSRIFSNIEAIYSFHKLFAKDLKAQKTAKGIAETFSTYADFLKMYTTYVNGYDRCCDTIEDMRNNSTFTDFVAQQRKDKITGGRTLVHYLIMPVQRIPLYELLLETMLKELGKVESEDSVTYTKLKEALGRVHAVGMIINENKRRAEDRNKVMELQAKLTGENKPVLVSPTRRLIKEGELQKLSTLNFKRVRKVFLFSDMLLWTTTSYRVRGSIELIRAQVVDTAQQQQQQSGSNADDPEESLGFEVVHPKKMSSLVLYAPSMLEKQQWVAAISDCIRALNPHSEQQLNAPAGGGGKREAKSPEPSSPTRTHSQDDSFVGMREPSRSGLMPSESLDERQHSEALGLASPRGGNAGGGGGRKNSILHPHALAILTGSGDDTKPSPDAASSKSGRKKPHKDSDLSEMDDDDAEEKEVVSLVNSLVTTTVRDESSADDDAAAVGAALERNLDERIIDLQRLTDDDIDRLRHFRNMPVAIKLALEAMGIALGAEPRFSDRATLRGIPDYFKPAMNFIWKQRFRTFMVTHAKNKLPIPNESLDLLQAYISNPLLDPVVLAKFSPTTSAIFRWVKARYESQVGHTVQSSTVDADGKSRRNPRRQGSVVALKMPANNNVVSPTKLRAKTPRAPAPDRKPAARGKIPSFEDGSNSSLKTPRNTSSSSVSPSPLSSPRLTPSASVPNITPHRQEEPPLPPWNNGVGMGAGHRQAGSKASRTGTLPHAVSPRDARDSPESLTRTQPLHDDESSESSQSLKSPRSRGSAKPTAPKTPAKNGKA